MDLDETWQVGMRPEKTKPCMFPAKSRYGFRSERKKWVAEALFLPARRYASAGLCDSDVSVCPSVCHTPVLCLVERKQDREMYTVW